MVDMAEPAINNMIKIQKHQQQWPYLFKVINYKQLMGEEICLELAMCFFFPAVKRKE